MGFEKREGQRGFQRRRQREIFDSSERAITLGQAWSHLQVASQLVFEVMFRAGLL